MLSFDDLVMMSAFGFALALFYAGIYKFSVFYHAHQIKKAKEEFNDGLHKPHFFGDGS